MPMPRKSFEDCKPEIFKACGYGFLTYGACGLAAALLANRFWPTFRRLTLPLKVYAAMSSGVIGFVIEGHEAEISCARRPVSTVAQKQQ
eukprot:CAMPEP_0184645338 /NCGR_PEP_ID=MMETSP0308-20130426/1815_1 /TAXON_ID=38269 /ORGANISM="Gloeochaete witrockiana, Strain SAG 46.84" /LENGTH=88 /DNA_ID=CAMNT_0027074255 /DNA_START=92 /DNA_END=361 /DNA_ORIENTATION=+